MPWRGYAQCSSLLFAPENSHFFDVFRQIRHEVQRKRIMATCTYRTEVFQQDNLVYRSASSCYSILSRNLSSTSMEKTTDSQTTHCPGVSGLQVLVWIVDDQKANAEFEVCFIGVRRLPLYGVHNAEESQRRELDCTSCCHGRASSMEKMGQEPKYLKHLKYFMEINDTFKYI
ncbi:hypothetical protein Ae201684_012414 [Aphanomyces euteiches]|uniref:Uncharacterized protein n=1 Tax=Aphanomyces euteiches TaxID=100861 RepID=A0A6G0WRS6_9STRA|nr:hypothetical protein Ae201684_012414 [Aphanomyces euteiches]